jgi:hypothetical protein
VVVVPQEQAVVQKGSYVCRVDARRLVQGKGLGQGPLFRSVVAQVSHVVARCFMSATWRQSKGHDVMEVMEGCLIAMRAERIGGGGW